MVLLLVNTLLSDLKSDNYVVGEQRRQAGRRGRRRGMGGG